MTVHDFDYSILHNLISPDEEKIYCGHDFNLYKLTLITLNVTDGSFIEGLSSESLGNFNMEHYYLSINEDGTTIFMTHVRDVATAVVNFCKLEIGTSILT